jgi:hypothetical protein
LKNYFKNSYSELVSFFAREQNMSVQEMEEIMQIMDQQIKNQHEKGSSGEQKTKQPDKNASQGNGNPDKESGSQQESGS